MATLPKTTHRLNANPYKNLNDIICRNRKIHLTIHIEFNGPGTAKNNHGKEKQNLENHTLGDFKTYCRANHNRCKDRNIDKWNITEGP